MPFIRMKVGKADLTLSGLNAFDQDCALFIRLSCSYAAIGKRNLVVDIFKGCSLWIDHGKTDISFIDHNRWWITATTTSVAPGLTAAATGHYGHQGIGATFCFKHAAAAASCATASAGTLADQYGRAAENDRAAMCG